MLRITGNTLEAGTLRLRFPAVRLALKGKIVEPQGEGKRVDAHTRIYEVDGITFTVRVEAFKQGWRKCVRIAANRALPTPDLVELDRQTVPDPQLSRRGYRATSVVAKRPGAEEEGGGQMPGCGYPLIGEHFFAGIEHPAAFANLEKITPQGAEYALVQHPVWSQDRTLELADVVFGWSNDAEKTFRDYVDAIRIPARKKPLVSLCSFWSDPYLGNYEYLIAPENYRTFVAAFRKLGITPDVYTLDAGWQDRKSIFAPKPAFHGEAGLWKLERFIRRCGSRLGLWVSHNGPMGAAPEYLEKRGFAVGAGESATYCGKGYAVMLDPKWEKALGDRLVELARAGIMQYKMDWDNDCATTPAFAGRYPTRDHVREGSINAMIRIARRIREANGDLMIRHGWWPSPWWLRHVHHVFLSDSGDSEFASLPSRTMRDAAATHRDTLYYCSFRRDRSAFPLDALDNHEFPHALRNPFHEEPGTFTDLTMLAILRGASYLPLTLQPEALEPWLANTLAKIMAFARAYGSDWYAARSSMFGGNPNAGAVYGFRFELQDGSAWCVLRNPAPVPQTWTWDQAEKRHGVWIYPFFAAAPADQPVLLAPHEVRVVRWLRRAPRLPFAVPFQAVAAEDGKMEFRFPAHLDMGGKAAPMVGEIYRLNGIECEWHKITALPDGFAVLFRLRLPYRMRRTTLDVTLPDSPAAAVEARLSRYCASDGSCAELPVTRLRGGVPGYGEQKNADTIPAHYEPVFTIPCAEGGEMYYTLYLHGITSVEQAKLSVSGFFAPSREPLHRKWEPAWLAKGLPPIHPDGFPVAQLLPIPDPVSLPKE